MMIEVLGRLRKRLKRYISISGADEIIRRYAVINSFDGLIAAFGIVNGLSLSGNLRSELAVISCMSSGISMALSGFLGVYMSEKAEREADIKELERHLVSSLRGTEIDRAMRVSVLLAALIDSLSPLLSAFIVTIPFILSMYGVLTVEQAYYGFMISSVVLLASLGYAMGRKSGRGLRYSALMVLIGIIVAVLKIFVG
jgi:predicted membrane protein (TIGR00267 family)